MKHLIGLLFCFGVLLLAGTTYTHAQTVPTHETTYQASCLDIGKPEISIGTAQNRFYESFAVADYAFDRQMQKGYTIDIQKLRHVSKQAVYKTNLALFYRYRYVPACPVQYVSKGYGRYFYYNHLYNLKPPKWQSNFNL
ncbi:MAG: hypothetical protein ACK5KN_16690 [Dysgonomonas sp.]|uniref:hypothetical protein n=1 Tax=Dysgonomonas sp. TaxID=1891233 RepID=UPI003A8A99D0